MPPIARPVRRRLLAGLVPLALALGALPLLAPTCGGGAPGPKTFARSSLIIPMERCYQYQTDAETGTGQPAGCPQAADPGDVVKAYGLVYQLIRNDVAVYWAINDKKTSVTGEDFHIQYDGGAPALRYDWNGGAPAGAPTTSHTISYMGGPFIVDGSDYDKASAVLQRYKATFSTVKVHVANVAFTANVQKTMAGGWNAGATVAPKLALLDIGSGNLTALSPPAVNDPKNAEPVIEGYLAKAGIGSGAAGGTALGPHGEIYDKLGIEDFQPEPGSTDPKTSRLFKNGYQILWVPHWVAPGSCSSFGSSANCAGSIYPQAKIDQVLRTIGAFVASGKDVFAECAGIGSFEGAFKLGVATANPGDYTIDYQDGDPASRFQTTNGVRYNELPDVNSSVSGKQLPAALIPGSYSSPLLQIGDYPFVPYTGAIEDFRPQNATAGGSYLPAPPAVPDVARLISATKGAPSTKYGDAFDAWDYFTLRKPIAGSHGTIVYLAGHSYSGQQGTFQIAGSRLVLNTLFNLGAGCTETGVTCNTGLPGVCGQGRLTCDPATGAPVCKQITQASTEVCDGLDNDCDGLVDEDLETSCYDGPTGTESVGLCRAGVRSCQRHADGTYAMSACTGEVLPSPEVCNGLDDNCDGKIDENLTQACYFGPLSSLDANGRPMGICQAGTQACTSGNWGACEGQVLPQTEICQEGTSAGLDENCNGQIDEECGCAPGTKRTCYSGPPGTAGVGLCKVGEQTCDSTTAWGPCVGEVVPAPEVCGNDLDENCNGPLDGQPPICARCVAGETQPCYSGPPSSVDASGKPKGVCKMGTLQCVNGDFGGACLGEVVPASADPCDGIDNDCDGEVDEDAACGESSACVAGVCVPKTCDGEQPCPEGYDCVTVSAAAQKSCQPGGCNGAPCAPGQKCQFGTCVDPCASVTCGEGNVCASGTCTGGSCYFGGCPATQVCMNGACVQDPCSDLMCPSGTFCRRGDCVQACTFVSCYEGEKCGEDGFCVADACAGKSCAPGDHCVDGACVADPCAGKSCGAGQVCQGGVCVDDPCADVKCPAGTCLAGQCYPTGNPTGAGTIPREKAAAGGCGCGSGGGTALLAILGALAAPLARRRRAPRGIPPLALLLAGVALLGAACKKPEAFDPAKCEATCDEQRCVDVQSDPAHCGTCGVACARAEICVDGTCGPGHAVAPFVAAIAPPSAAMGGVATIELTGERFAPGATLRSASPSGTRTFAADVVDATRLRVTLDLSDALPTTWQVRVVNPDHVISNGVAFDVFRPSPEIASIDPAQVKSGTTTDVRVSGTGFTPASQCHLSGARLVEIALPSALSGAALLCTVDASSLAPGAYDLWVVNEGGLASGKTTLTVTSDLTHVAAVSPSSGGAGEIVSITVTGSGFDPASVVVFDGKDQVTTFISPSQLFVYQVALPASASDYPVRVRNGSGALSADSVMFTVGQKQAQITGVSPGTGYQGDQPTVTFTGSGLDAATRIEASPPAGTFSLVTAAAGTCTTTCTAISAVLDLTGAVEGQWLLRLAFPDGSKSAAWSFRVLSNQAILRDADPRGGLQGTSPIVALTVANLREPYADVRVLFGPAGAAPAALQSLTPSPVPSGTTVQVSLPLAGADTGTYQVQVVNPAGATPSNAISFNVTPGLPTLASVSPASAKQTDTLVTVTLTGTNFAKPDASGNGGSVVHVSAVDASLGIPDQVIPAASTTVVSTTRIDVRFDTRTGLVGKYTVSVWNPSAPTTVPPAPQKSATQPFEILPYSP